MQQTKTPTPTYGGYSQQTKAAGQGMSPNAHGAEVVDPWGLAGRNVSGALMDLSGALLTHQEKMDKTALLEAQNKLNQAEREMLSIQLRRVGSDAAGYGDQLGVTAAAEEFYQKQQEKFQEYFGQRFRNRPELAEQFKSYLDAKKDNILRSLDQYQIRQENVWSDDVLNSSALIMQRDATTPTASTQSLDFIIKDIAGTYSSLNPGRDMTAAIISQQAGAVNEFIIAKLASGEVAQAQKALNKYEHLFDADHQLKLKGAIFETQAQGQVNRLVSDYSGSGNFYDAYNGIMGEVTSGNVSYEMGTKALRAIDAQIALETKALKVKYEADNEAAIKEMITLQANNELNDKIIQHKLDKGLISSAQAERFLSNLIADKTKIDPVEKRELYKQAYTKQASGEFTTPDQVYDWLKTVDPNAVYFSPEYASKWIDNIKEELTGEKYNYYAAGVTELATEFKLKPGSPERTDFEMKAVAVLNAAKIDKYDPKAYELIATLRQPEKRKTLGLFETPLYKSDKETLVKHYQYERKDPLLNEYLPNESPPGAINKNEIAEKDILAALTGAGMPDTIVNRTRAKQAIKNNTTPWKELPSGASTWGGKGRVTIKHSKVNQYNNLIEKHALSYNLDPNLIAAMMIAESAGNPKAVSRNPKTGEPIAHGLMQFIPSTARHYGITDPYDPEQSIKAACLYMNDLLNTYDGDLVRALGAYNAGPNNVNRGRAPQETKNYITQITKAWGSTYKQSVLNEQLQLNGSN